MIRVTTAVLTLALVSAVACSRSGVRVFSGQAPVPSGDLFTEVGEALEEMGYVIPYANPGSGTLRAVQISHVAHPAWGGDLHNYYGSRMAVSDVLTVRLRPTDGTTDYTIETATVAAGTRRLISRSFAVDVDARRLTRLLRQRGSKPAQPPKAAS